MKAINKRQSNSPKPEEKRPIRRALTPEAREQQMIKYAIDIAEQKLMDGTAPNAMVMYYLKLGSSREKLEQELLEKQTELATAKAEAYHSSEEIKELYKDAMRAFSRYSGHADYYEEEPDDTDI